jgi:hypothetical protein
VKCLNSFAFLLICWNSESQTNNLALHSVDIRTTFSQEERLFKDWKSFSELWIWWRWGTLDFVELLQKLSHTRWTQSGGAQSTYFVFKLFERFTAADLGVVICNPCVNYIETRIVIWLRRLLFDAQLPQVCQSSCFGSSLGAQLGVTVSFNRNVKTTPRPTHAGWRIHFTHCFEYICILKFIFCPE